MEFRVGDSIEVCSKEEGFEGSYYAATIIKPAVWNKKSKKNTQYLVEYKTLLSDDEKHLDRQVFDVSDLRPSPPEFKVPKFELYDAVDAFHNDGWWFGVIVSRNRGKYMVHFLRTSEKIEYNFSQLRVHQFWKNGEWIPSQTYPGKSVPSQTYPKLLSRSSLLDEEDAEIERVPNRTLKKVFTRDSVMPKYAIEKTSSNGNANGDGGNGNGNADGNVDVDFHEIVWTLKKMGKKIFTRDSIRPKYVIETSRSIIETTTSNGNGSANEIERAPRHTIKIISRNSIMPKYVIQKTRSNGNANANAKRSRSDGGKDDDDIERVPKLRMKKIFTNDSIMPRYVLETTRRSNGCTFKKDDLMELLQID